MTVEVHAFCITEQPWDPEWTPDHRMDRITASLGPPLPRNWKVVWDWHWRHR